MIPEFHRPVALDRIGPHGLDLTVEANPAECCGARRPHEPSGRAGAVLRIPPDPGGPRYRPGDAVCCRRGSRRSASSAWKTSTRSVEEIFQVCFVPSGEESDDIDPESDDEIPFEGNQIDLGEAAAEQLGLALDPYPRMPGVEMPQVEDESEPHPFAAFGAA